MPDSIPDAQRMADLLGGHLSAAERERLLGELAASEDALAVYADAAAASAELERAGLTLVLPAAAAAAAPGVVPDPAPNAVPPGSAPNAADPSPVVALDEVRKRRRAAGEWRVRRWAVAAAAAVVVAVAPALWWRARPDAAADGAVPSYAALLAEDARAAGLPAGWDGAPWRVTRGAGDPLTPEARAVRLGARVTDLELAAAAGDTTAVRAIAAEAAALLDEVPGAGAAAAAYRALGGPGAAGRGALARARRDAALVAGEEAFALGAWLEAARVAAARRDGAFFRSEESRAALGRVRGSGGKDAASAGARVAAAISHDPPTWGPLGGALETLLRLLAS